MSRHTLAALTFGWLLGIVTALATPTLVWQRQTLMPANGAALRQVFADGWYVIRQDEGIITLERPRFRLP